MDDRRNARLVTLLLLLAVALVGLAHLALLPPWEGFDETAHWSYIQEMADTGRPPRYGADGLSRDIDAYRGPMAYSGAPPFDQTSRATLRSYRQSGAPALAGGPTRYDGDSSSNWQAQHPPLYYLLLTPAYRLAHGLGWVDHLLVLRLVSFVFAFAGFALGVVSVARRADRFGVWAAPIVAAWPFLVPQFFPEFARLGNDSLCLLLAAAAWACLLRLVLEEGDGWRPAAGLGLALGLGLLTKAFFLPIGAGAGAVLLARWWTNGRRMAALGQAALAGLLALAIGGWWYVETKLETGSLMGAGEFIRLAHAGGGRELEAGFSVFKLVQGLVVLFGTFLWAGTWSMARLPEVWLVLPAALLLVSGVDYLRRLWKRRAGLADWTPLALAAPMAAGLVFHIFIWIAGTTAQTPGWYVHILAGPLGLAVALGWRRPRLLAALAGATALGAAAAWGFQLSMFSGCAAKIGDDKHYSLTGAGCFLDPHVLARLGHPALGGASLALGVTAALAAAALAWRAFRPQAPAPLSALTGTGDGLQPL